MKTIKERQGPFNMTRVGLICRCFKKYIYIEPTILSITSTLHILNNDSIKLKVIFKVNY